MKSSTLDYLNQLGETKIDFEFERSVALNQLVYKNLPIITICGTNGKGSTTAFLENILIQAGYRVGAYTSPHLEHIRERIRINGQPISETLFEQYGQEMKRIVESANISPTYFEFLTFFGLHLLQEEKVDIAIFEVGLGGRLDSVHAIPRIGAILTSISLDHQDYLGDTITKIAKEKLPVLQSSPFSIVSKQDPEVDEFIQSTLTKPHLTEGKDFQHSGSSDLFVYEHGSFRLGPVKLGLRADHQSSNAACATAMAIYLHNHSWKIQADHISQGLIRTTNPGRIEKWTNADGSQVWLDVAHNADAMEKLVQYLYLRDIVDFQTVFGCSNDKPWQQMIEPLKAVTKQFHWVSTPTPRSWKPEDLELQNPVECVQELIRKKQFPILCTGSFYHVGVIRKLLPELQFHIE